MTRESVPDNNEIRRFYKTEPALNKVIRWAFALINLSLAVWSALYRPFWFLALFFTNWTLYMTLALFVASVLFQHGYMQRWYSVYLRLFDICVTMNVLVTLVYWTALHTEYSQQPHVVADPNRLYLSILCHSVPFISHTTNYLLTKHVVLYPLAAIYDGALLMALYSVYNFAGCYYAQVKIYWFLDWEKPIAYYSIAIIYVVMSLIHFVCGKISVSSRSSSSSKNR